MNIPTLKIADWYNLDWDLIPSLGEPVLIRRQDLGKTYLKIGDGIRALDMLPIIDERMIREVTACNKVCANCEHLFVINRNKVYAVCDELGKTFELWKMDTRATDAEHCTKFVPIDDGYGNGEV